MYYALVHVSGKRFDFGNRSELLRWITQHSCILNRSTTLKWYLYRTEKTPFNFCNRVLSSCICSLHYYMSKNKLFDYGKKDDYGKKEKINPAVVPCGNRID